MNLEKFLKYCQIISGGTDPFNPCDPSSKKEDFDLFNGLQIEYFRNVSNITARRDDYLDADSEENKIKMQAAYHKKQIENSLEYNKKTFHKFPQLWLLK